MWRACIKSFCALSILLCVHVSFVLWTHLPFIYGFYWAGATVKKVQQKSARRQCMKRDHQHNAHLACQSRRVCVSPRYCSILFLALDAIDWIQSEDNAWHYILRGGLLCQNWDVRRKSYIRVAVKQMAFSLNKFLKCYIFCVLWYQKFEKSKHLIMCRSDTK